MDPSSLSPERRPPRPVPTAEEYTNTLSMYQKRVAWSEEVREKNEGERVRVLGPSQAARGTEAAADAGPAAPHARPSLLLTTRAPRPTTQPPHTHNKRQEDALLTSLVERFGTHAWPEVAAALPGRTSKSCSLRWRCFLSPNLSRPSEHPLTEWEIAVIVQTQRAYGNRWSFIASLLPGRCNNDVKNHFNLYLRGPAAVASQPPEGSSAAALGAGAAADGNGSGNGVDLAAAALPGAPTAPAADGPLPGPLTGALATNSYLLAGATLQSLLRDAPDDILRREREVASRCDSRLGPMPGNGAARAAMAADPSGAAAAAAAAAVGGNAGGFAAVMAAAAAAADGGVGVSAGGVGASAGGEAARPRTAPATRGGAPPPSPGPIAPSGGAGKHLQQRAPSAAAATAPPPTRACCRRHRRRSSCLGRRRRQPSP